VKIAQGMSVLFAQEAIQFLDKLHEPVLVMLDLNQRAQLANTIARGLIHRHFVHLSLSYVTGQYGNLEDVWYVRSRTLEKNRSSESFG
jgi:hypothetical protein